MIHDSPDRALREPPILLDLMVGHCVLNERRRDWHEQLG